MKILFVCTGNICRSPLAEALMRHEGHKRGLPDQVLEVSSAGTHGYHQGERPDYRSIEVARQSGVSMDGQTARKVTLDDFRYFDLILAMDAGHLEGLRQIAPPDANAHIALFMGYAAGHNTSVPDPYYGEMRDFIAVRDMVSQGVDQLLTRLEKANQFNAK